MSFQRGTEKYHEKSEMAAGKGWGVAYYKQDYPERDLDDDVVRAPPPQTNAPTHIIDSMQEYVQLRCEHFKHLTIF